MKTIRLIILLAAVLLTFTVKAQTEEMTRVKIAVAKIFKNGIEIYDKKSELKGIPKNIEILDDGIVFSINRQKTIISFSEMFDWLSFKYTENTRVDGDKYLAGNEWHLRNYILYFRLDDEANKQLEKDLIFINRQKLKNQFESQLISFEPIAAKYRSLKDKPSISEEQRKYIVQANGFSEQKIYIKAIELYKKAIDVDPTSYPAAYSNLALLSTQTSNFISAIYYMKMYLMLEPGAEDARSAQDNIYLWEAQLENN